MNWETKYFHAFNLIPDISPLRFKRLLSYFPNLKEAFLSPLLELKRAGLEEKIAQKILTFRSQIDPEKELDRVKKQNIDIITLKDKGYPSLLKEIYNPPALLYVRGKIKNQNGFYLAVVGTRKPSSYGRQATFQLIGLLAQTKITIVSGLALGIDALAHQASLDFGAHTVAVLGGGSDDQSIYPRSNFGLAQKILERGGGLLSEYPPGTRPLPQNFPQRNRIISGLSLGTLVIEAGEKSGTSITARAALEQNREVFAVPGSIYSLNSRGTNNLIKMGAKLVSCVQDILDELNLDLIVKPAQKEDISPASQEEATLLKYLSAEPTHIDALIEKSKLSSSQISPTLTIMEMQGKVRNVGSGNYVLI